MRTRTLNTALIALAVACSASVGFANDCAGLFDNDSCASIFDKPEKNPGRTGEVDRPDKPTPKAEAAPPCAESFSSAPTKSDVQPNPDRFKIVDDTRRAQLDKDLKECVQEGMRKDGYGETISKFVSEKVYDAVSKGGGEYYGRDNREANGCGPGGDSLKERAISTAGKALGPSAGKCCDDHDIGYSKDAVEASHREAASSNRNGSRESQEVKF